MLWSIRNIWLLGPRTSLLIPFLLAGWQLSAINCCAGAQRAKKRVTSGWFSGPSLGVRFEGFLWIKLPLIRFRNVWPKNNSWLANYGNQIQFSGANKIFCESIVNNNTYLWSILCSFMCQAPKKNLWVLVLRKGQNILPSCHVCHLSCLMPLSDYGRSYLAMLD